MLEATLNYLAPMAERPNYYLYPPPAGESWRNTRGDRRKMPIADAREIEPPPTLDREGFALARLTTAHTAFDDPHAPADAPPRESIEVRTMAFF